MSRPKTKTRGVSIKTEQSVIDWLLENNQSPTALFYWAIKKWGYKPAKLSVTSPEEIAQTEKGGEKPTK